MKYLQFLLTISLVLTFQINYAQWVKEKGNGYYKITAWTLVADKHYTSSGAIDSNATRGNFTFSLYGEYGVTNKIDVLLYFPLFTRIYQNTQVSKTKGNVLQEGQAFNAIGDVDLGLRYSLFKKKYLAVSTTLKMGLPTGRDNAGSDGSYQTGDGEFNQLFQLDIGTSYQLYSEPSYTKAYVGFNNRTQGFSDEFHLGVETGVKFWRKLWGVGRLNIVKSFSNGTLSVQNAQGSIFANNVEYVSIGTEVAYDIVHNIGVSLTWANAISGRIIYANPSCSLGVFLDLQ